jgi:hypothetical protein
MNPGLVDGAPVAHHHRSAGSGGHGGIVGDHDDRLPGIVHASQQLEDLGATSTVERPRRFVSEEQRGRVGQRPGEGEALALAAG